MIKEYLPTYLPIAWIAEVYSSAWTEGIDGLSFLDHVSCVIEL